MTFIDNPSDGISEANSVLKAEGFYISYNPGTGMKFSFFAGDNGVGSDETALVKDRNFYILNGDHRKEYEELVDKGFDVCYDYFLSKPELKSSWSN